jgi:hypothetical protein
VSRKKYTTFTMSFSGQEALKDALMAEAKRQRRSLSRLIQIILEDYMRTTDEGYALKEAKGPVSSKVGSDSMIQIGPHGAVSYGHSKQPRAKKRAALVDPVPTAQPKT